MRAEAGFEKPQDCRVTVTLRDGGGREILLHSKQEALFGGEIRRCAAQCLDELGAENVVVEIFDYGCLNFAIRARIKTAFHRAVGNAEGGKGYE